jgi:hypothetical protein
MSMSLDGRIAQVFEAAGAVAAAKNTESRLEDERALVKRDAIKRLLDSGAAPSPTAAEKIVESDADYAAHRALQRQATLATMLAWASWEAARARVRMLTMEFQEMTHA